MYTIFFFFFQAEDGIRDRNVTGVQTCALPISDQLAEDVRIEEQAAERLGQARVVVDEQAGRGAAPGLQQRWQLAGQLAERRPAGHIRRAAAGPRPDRKSVV